MNAQTSIPADVLQMIENKKQQLRAEQAAKADADKREQDELFAKGSQLYMDARKQKIEKLPEWVRVYVDEPTLEIDDYVRLGRGYGQPDSFLSISIPGLSRILFDPNKQVYLAARAWWNGYEEREPELNFHKDDGWRNDLEDELCRAERELKEHQENLAKWEAAKQESLRRYNEREAYDQAADERAKELAQARAEQEARDERGELYTFDVLKNDAIALHLVKAFLLLQHERAGFETRLQDADEALYSIENRWSRRADELRRQADEAERRAADEKSRLQDELDDAEKKAKKLERGW